ncbi:MAG: dihydrolipoamide succinyltransferase, partial [Comamonadaceae bacterium]
MLGAAGAAGALLALAPMTALHAASPAWPDGAGDALAPDLGERLDQGVRSGELRNL